MNAALYLVGAMAYVAWRWMKWLSAQPAGTPVMGFVRARLAANASSLIVSILMMGAYLSGAMGTFLRAMVPEAIDSQIPQFYQERWAAPIAGFAITFAARRIIQKFADKIGEKENGE